MPRTSITALLLLLIPVAAGAEIASGAENWPGWRGPRGDGTSGEKDVPIRWSGADGESQSIAWKTPLPGLGHASPVVWGDRIFTITCVPETEARQLLCLDRRSGKLLWRQTVFTAPLERKHQLNSFASSTPATDGRSVYVSLLRTGGKETPDPNHPAGKLRNIGQMVIAAYDFQGKQQWIVEPGVFASIHGYSSSPVLFENLVIVNGDHDGDGYLVALDRETGKTVWKTPRPNNTRSYCTPIIRQVDGRTQMMLSGSKCVASYDPRTGKQQWIIDGPTEQYVASMVYNGELLFMTAGFPDKHILAIRPDGSGNVTDSHVVWRTTKACSYVPSPIVVGDYFLVVADNGVASCYQAESGKLQWMERIGRRYSASLVAADGLVYFTSDDGVTTVVRPGPSFDAVAENKLGERTYASPAICDGRIYLRGERHLFAIGTAAAE